MSVTGEIKNLYSDKDKTRVLLPRTKTKAVSDENGTSLDVLLDGKAPAGYGLGEGAGNGLSTISGLDAVKVNSFRNYYGEPLPVEGANYNDVSQGGVLTIYAQGMYTQYFFLRYPNTGCVLKRHTPTDGSLWYEWEWVNPPMALGVEYRTTERYNGKAVYTQLVNMGSLPNNDSKHIALVNCFTEARPNFSVVRYEYRLDGGTYRSVNPTHLDQLGTTNIFWSVVKPNNTQWYAFVHTDYDASKSMATGQIWYTID